MDVHNWESGFFFQDTWKLTSRLTLNLGLRYELITPFIDANDLIANFDPNYSIPRPASSAASSSRPPRRSNISIRASSTLATSSPTIWARRWPRHSAHRQDDWSPRIGLAWRIGNKSVIRGGYGIYYPTSAAQGIRDPIATNPFNQSVTKRDAAGNPLQGWPGNGVDGISPVSGGAVAPRATRPQSTSFPSISINRASTSTTSPTSAKSVGTTSSASPISAPPCTASSPAKISTRSHPATSPLASARGRRRQHRSRPNLRPDARELRHLARGLQPLSLPGARRLPTQLRKLRPRAIQRVPDPIRTPLHSRPSAQSRLHVSRPEIDCARHRQLQPRRHRL